MLQPEMLRPEVLLLPEVLRPEVLLPEVLPMPRPAVLRPEVLLLEVLPMLPHVNLRLYCHGALRMTMNMCDATLPTIRECQPFNLLMLAMPTAVHLHVGHASSDIGVLVVSL